MKYTDGTKLALGDIASQIRHSKGKVWCMKDEKQKIHKKKKIITNCLNRSHAVFSRSDEMQIFN